VFYVVLYFVYFSYLSLLYYLLAFVRVISVYMYIRNIVTPAICVHLIKGNLLTYLQLTFTNTSNRSLSSSLMSQDCYLDRFV